MISLSDSINFLATDSGLSCIVGKIKPNECTSEVAVSTHKMEVSCEEDEDTFWEPDYDDLTGRGTPRPGDPFELDLNTCRAKHIHRVIAGTFGYIV
ncbi:hypothetical protein Dimus_015914 [Dionaea muscipula]